MTKRAEQRESLLQGWLNDYVMLANAQQQNPEAAEILQARLEELAAVGQPLDKVLDVHRRRLIESCDAQLASLTESKVRKAVTEQAEQTRRRVSTQRRQLRALRASLGNGRASANGTRKPARKRAKAKR